MQPRLRAKPIILTLICVLTVLFAFAACSRAAAPGDDTSPPAAETEQQDDGNGSEDEDEDENRPLAKPDRFLIEKIDVDAHIEHVAKDDDGRMAVPEEWENVAWYELGPLPGDEGNAVIAGHYDSYTGPAVFYELFELELEDEIRVITEDDEELVFEVTEIEYLHVDDISSPKIFGETEEYKLNLVTCGGYWDPSLDMYDHRLIIYTTLISG